MQFLDINVNIEEKLRLSVYDKTDDFPFNVVKYGFADSSVHTKIGIGVFYSQLIRFARISSDVRDFEQRVSDIFYGLLRHGYCRSALLSKFFRFVTNNQDLLYKFGFWCKRDIVLFVTRVFER